MICHRIIPFLLLLLVINLSAQNQSQPWDFEPGIDPFSQNALLDLRYLNEQNAGDGGFIRLSSDSSSFVDSTGKPLRFWAVNGGENTTSWSDADLARFARFLAKIGVNAIRYHGSLHPVTASSDFNKANPNEIKNIQRLVTAMKKEGIYTIISPYYSHKVGEVFPNWNIPEYTGKSPKLDGVIFFHDGLRNACKQWVTELFTASNPYGLPLKDEPAVAVIQTHNEDGMFFFTIQNVKPGINQIMRKRFYTWLVNKYKTIDDAQKAWGNITIEGDNPSIGEMGIYIIWEATQPTSGAKHKRLTDQIEYFAEVQSGFYREMKETFRAVGCKQLINGSNWKTADAVRLLDAERSTAGVCDVIALNRYYSPMHTGYKSTPDNSAWRIDPGHYYEGKSVLLAPESLPVNIKQPLAHPVMVTESGWNNPHKYQAEGPFLVSAYSSLNGIDAFFWFTASAPGYDSNPYFYWTNLEGGQHPLHRWTASTPGQMAMFPANALSHRLGYVAESKPIAFEHRTANSIYQREIPMVSEDMGFDPNRDDYVPVTGQTELSGISYLAGKIQVKYNVAENSKTIDPQLSDWINFQAKTVKSSTGELMWDYKNGICKLDAPASQGVCGFVGKAGTINLKDVVITTKNEYAAINVVSMDKNPLSASAKILVQVGTVYQPSNWSESQTTFTYKNVNYNGFLINNTGAMPWKCVGTDVTISIKNKNIQSATLLDVNGYAVKSIELNRNGDLVSCTLPPETMYVVFQGTATSANGVKKKVQEIKVWPNPAETALNIDFGTQCREVLVKMVSMDGRHAKTCRFSTGASVVAMDVSDLTSGLYIAEIKTDNLPVVRQKFLKM